MTAHFAGKYFYYSGYLDDQNPAPLCPRSDDCCPSAPLRLAAEVVFTNNGKIYQGKIIEETKNGMTFREYNGISHFFPSGTILRTVYTEVYLGKQVIKKTSGEDMEVFVVAEDRDAYIYRFKLDSPEEHKVLRKDVMFITRKDPTGLTAKPDQFSVYLSWNAPYGGAKKYHVHYREIPVNKKEQSDGIGWKIAGDTSSLKYTISGLESKKRYQFRVTSIDKSGYESHPSNEEEVTTANRDPGNPPQGDAKKNITGRNMSVDLSWNAAVDSDGAIKSYTVYQLTKEKPLKVAETPGLSYTILGLDPALIYGFRVIAEDSDGSVSKPGLYLDTRYRRAIEPAVSGMFLMPFGSFGDVAGPGGGFTLSCYFNDVFFYNLRLGISAGYAHYSPANENYTSAYTITGAVQAAWKFYLTDSIYAAPRVSAGYARTGIEYSGEYLETFVDAPASDGGAPTASVGAELGFDFFEKQSVTVAIDYRAVIESSVMHAVSIEVGYGYKL